MMMMTAKTTAATEGTKQHLKVLQSEVCASVEEAANILEHFVKTNAKKMLTLN